MTAKIQHYVPRFYLQEWCIPKTNQVYVYDKVKREHRPTNIEKIASEKYFYDYKMRNYFSEEQVQAMDAKGLTEKGRLKIIEQMLSDRLEGPISGLYYSLVKNAREATPWIRKECFFISAEQKEKFSVYLAYQLLRTRAVRTQMLESSKRIEEFCRRIGVAEKKIKEIALEKDAASRLHNRMMLDKEQIYKTSYLINSLVWVLMVNKTNVQFLTSDNPIGMVGHDKERSPLLGVGLASPGVEVFFPVAPDMMMVMLDGDFLKEVAKEDRRYFEAEKVKTIEHYNDLTAKNATRMIISKDDCFGVMGNE